MKYFFSVDVKYIECSGNRKDRKELQSDVFVRVWVENNVVVKHKRKQAKTPKTGNSTSAAEIL